MRRERRAAATPAAVPLDRRDRRPEFRPDIGARMAVRGHTPSAPLIKRDYRAPERRIDPAPMLEAGHPLETLAASLPESPGGILRGRATGSRGR